MSQARRFPPPWSVEELEACFVVRDHDGQQLAYVYFGDEPGRRSAARIATPRVKSRNEAVQQRRRRHGKHDTAITTGAPAATTPLRRRSPEQLRLGQTNGERQPEQKAASGKGGRWRWPNCSR